MARVRRLTSSGVSSRHSPGFSERSEIGPKRVLAGLNRKIDRAARTTNIGKAADLAA